MDKNRAIDPPNPVIWEEPFMSFPLAIYVAFFTIITAAAFGFIVRRLLGVNFSLGRLLIAGAIALFSGQYIIAALVPSELRTSKHFFPLFWFVVLGTFIGLLCGMAFLVIAEMLVPSNTLPGPLYMVRATQRWLQRAARYSQITGIIIRHGLGAYLRGGRRSELQSSEGRADLARSLRAALNEGGVTFVKMGQIMATRRDLLPPVFIEELSLLQSKAAEVPWTQIEPVIQRSLAPLTIDEVFAEIDQKPLAAASIAQIHAARLKSGGDVVLKIRRPGITSQVERDLDIAERLARMLERSTDWGRSIGTVDLAHGFAVALREELDLRVEARNIAVVAAADSGMSSHVLHIPVVYPELSSERVLVMERIFGIPLSEAHSAIVERGLDATKLARGLLNELLQEIVVDGVFHADPHPGNVMLLANGQLALLDFGSVGRIDRLLRGALVRLILAIDRRDPLAAVDALLDLTERPDDLNEHRLERALGQFMALHLTPGSTPDMRMFTDLVQVVTRFGLAVPPEVAAIFRSIATLEGTLTRIDPTFNIVNEARSFATGYMGQQLQPRSIQRSLTDELLTLLPMLRRMPRRIDRIATALEEGRLSVNVRALADERDRRAISGMLHEALVAILAATAGLMAVIMIGHSGGPQLTSAVSMFQFIGYSLLVISLILAMRVLVMIFRASDEQ